MHITFLHGLLLYPPFSFHKRITLVACPENSLLDSKVLFKPVVTPYELELALVEDRQWDGKYSADFRDLLVGGANDKRTTKKKKKSNTMEEDEDEDEDEEERGGGRRGGDGVVTPAMLEWRDENGSSGKGQKHGVGEDDDEEGSDVYISLLDGKVHNRRGRANEQEDEEEEEEILGGSASTTTTTTSTTTTTTTTTVALPNLQQMSPRERHELSVLPAKNAADYMLRMREYRGLEQRLGKDAPAAAIEGMSGIAWDYHESEKVQERAAAAAGGEEVETNAPELMDIKPGEVNAKGANVISLSSGDVGGGGGDGEALVEMNDGVEVEEDAPNEMKESVGFSLFGNLSSSSEEDEDEEEEEEE